MVLSKRFDIRCTRCALRTCVAGARGLLRQHRALRLPLPAPRACLPPPHNSAFSGAARKTWHRAIIGMVWQHQHISISAHLSR